MLGWGRGYWMGVLIMVMEVVPFSQKSAFLLIKHIFVPKRNLPPPTFLKTCDPLGLAFSFPFDRNKVRRNVSSSS